MMNYNTFTAWDALRSTQTTGGGSVVWATNATSTGNTFPTLSDNVYYTITPDNVSTYTNNVWTRASWTQQVNEFLDEIRHADTKKAQQKQSYHHATKTIGEKVPDKKLLRKILMGEG